MTDNSAHLLRYKWQTEQFKERYEKVIEESATRLAEWFRTLPLYEWTVLPWTGNKAKVAVGILCILHQEGRINLTFNSAVSHVMRNASSDEEFYQYTDKIWPQKETLGQSDSME